MSRAELVVEMSSEALLILKAKIRQIDNALSEQATISQSITSNGDKTDPKIAQLIDYSQSELIRICRPFSEVVETDINFTSMSSMLLEMDAVCGASLRTFQSLLPEVQTRTCAQRRVILLDILMRYSCLYLTDEPPVVTSSNHRNSENEGDKNNENENDKNSDGKRGAKSDENNHKNNDEDSNRHKRDEDKAKGNTTVEQKAKPEGEEWLKYTTWYSKRKVAMQEIERDFSSFVEDEREKEGRLLKKWLSLSDPTESSLSFSSSLSSSSSATATATTASAAFRSSPARLNTSGNNNTSSNNSSNSSNTSSSSFSNNNAVRPRRSSAGINDTSFPSPTTPVTAHTETVTVTVTPDSKSEKYQGVSCVNSNRVRASSDSVIDASRTRGVLTHLKHGVESNVFESTYVTCTTQEDDKVKRSNITPSEGSSLRQRAVQRLTSDTVPYSTTLASQLHSPRCMTAFIEYFCSYYIATPYGLYGMKGGEDLLEALKVILEVLWTVDSI